MLVLALPGVVPPNTGGELPEIDYGYKYMIHNRPVGQSMPNYQSISIYTGGKVILGKEKTKDYFHATLVNGD